MSQSENQTTTYPVLLNLVKQCLHDKFHIEESMGPVRTGIYANDITLACKITVFEALTQFETTFRDYYYDSPFYDRLGIDLILAYDCNGEILIIIEK